MRLGLMLISEVPRKQNVTVVNRQFDSKPLPVDFERNRDVTPVGRNVATEINGAQRSPGKD
jgi:hypothetical protein